MKKRLLLLCCLMTVALAVCALFAVGCGPTEEEVPEITETVRYSEKTNPYAELTWQEYKDIDDWGKKQKEAPIYYQFEGSYSEAYQGNYSRTFLYMNCYEDGSLHATFGNENYYGFWTNVDRRGRTNVVLHIVRYNDREYNGGVYESVCEAMTHEYYEYSSTIIWDSFGTRTVLISGGHYSPVKSLTVSGGQTKAMVGDDFSTDGLKVTVTREDGKSTDIDEQSFPQNDCRVKFSGYDSTTEGNHEITVTYINTDVTATYNCEVFGLGGISVDASEAKTTYYIGDTLDTKGLAIKADRNDGEKVSLAAKRCKFEGFDTSKAAESLAVKIKFADFETTYNIKVVEPTFKGNANYAGGSGEIALTLVGDKDCEVAFDGKTAKLNYTTRTVGEQIVYNLSRPADDTTITDAEWKGLHKQYICDKAALTLSMAMVYTIPDYPQSDREENEPMPGIGGNTEQRVIFLDSETKEATISYKYWYADHTDTFICKYTLEGDILTFTDLVKVVQVGGNGSQYGNLHKTWRLTDDFIAYKYTPEAE